MDQSASSDGLSLDEILKASTPTIKGRKYTKEKKSRFIKGPISYDWITKASCLSGTALKLGLILFYLTGLTKSRTVKLSNRYLDEFGIHRSSKYRTLKAMEEAGLISYTIATGSSPLVTILGS